MLLDLNLDVISKEDSSFDHQNNNMNKKLIKILGMEECLDSSTSSSSSIINTTEEDNNSSSSFSSNNSCLYMFDILKKETATNDSRYNNNNNISPSNYNKTQQFFPERGTSDGLELDLKSSASELLMGFTRPDNQWLNLSLMEGITSTRKEDHNYALDQLKIMDEQKQQQVQVMIKKKKTRRGPRSRSSQYRGVTFYRRTGRWESHIWDCGKQIYLGGFDTAHIAARAYDQAALKFRGVDADINFNLSDYEDEMKQMKDLSKEEFVQILRRKSTGHVRMSSRFRGVTTLHKCRRWEAPRVEQLHGNKAYDKQCNGREAVTNFDSSTYEREILSDFKRAGGGHNLELSLGISQPPNKAISNDNVATDCHFQCELSTKTAALRGVPLPFKNLQSVPALYPAFQSKLEGRAVDAENKSKEVVSSSPRSRSLAWLANGNKGINIMSSQLASSVVAASSGFSNSASNTSPFFSYRT